LSLEHLQEQVREAALRKRPLRLRGGGTKDFYGCAGEGEVLDTRGYAGIVAYEPTELVVTARCGTALAELEQALDAHRQYLPFEPPHFGAGATVGGCVAAGLSGPRRASAGALRDFVLGTKLVDGRGRALSFGGQVMKNVAGYDISRLVAGSLGTLGVIAEVSLKVLPRPPVEATLELETDAAGALERVNAWAGQPLPVSATAWHDGRLRVRLSGSESALRAARQKIGATPFHGDADAFWRDIREQSHPFFGGTAPLWRLALPSIAPPLAVAGEQLIEWSGGLRWLRCADEPARIQAAAARAGGHATLFRASAGVGERFAPLEEIGMRLHRALKNVFDPEGILNPGRMYPGI
jgi:glycolate oxidase FAD binding subunit